MSISMNSVARLVLSLVTFGAIVCSCHHIPLMDPYSGVYIKFNIRIDPDMFDYNLEDYPYPNIVRGSMPHSLRVCFYDIESHDLVMEEYVGSEGGFINVEAGVYDIVVYNLGTEVTRVTGTASRAGAYAYTSNSGSILNMSKADENGEVIQLNYPVIYEPDHLYVGRKENVEIPVVAADNRVLVIEVDMSTLLESYTFEILNIVGAERIQSATCFVTGQSPQRYLWDKRHPGNLCAITFGAPVDVEHGVVRTAFNTFGRYPYSTSGVYVNFLVNDKGGHRYQWIFDITEQFDDPDNERHEIKIINTIVIPEEEQGGFTPSVGDWNAEIVYVPL